MTSHENKELVRFMYSITDNFFRSLVYSIMLFENVWPERVIRYIPFINGLVKFLKGVGVMLRFLVHLG